MPTLVSVQVGKVKTYEFEGKEWTSAIDKSPVRGIAYVGKLGISGDEQANPESHGGEHKAVLAYSANHYALWNETLNRQMPYGAFGDNLTIEGLNEDTVCIGDTYQIGNIVQLQVTNTRTPCYKLDRLWGIPNLREQVKDSGRTGWYLRVIREGMVEAGNVVKMLDRKYPQWTIRRVQEVFYDLANNHEAAQELANLPETDPSWKTKVLK